MFDVIRKDLSRCKFCGPRGETGLVYKFQTFFMSYGLHAIIVYRFGRWITEIRPSLPFMPIKYGLFAVYKLSALIVRGLYDIHLHNSAVIGPGLSVGHFGGIHVANCTLGDYCSIHQHVHINSSRQDPGPRIGSFVWIGAHTNIQGDIVIGDGVTVGAGSTVIHDVPPNCLIMGRPARVVQKNYGNRKLLNVNV